MQNAKIIVPDEEYAQGDVLLQAKNLVEKIKNGDESQVDVLLNLISEATESQLFQEVGKMTRQLHDALEKFRKDSRIGALAENEIPDARERLSYVITMTQNSANRTLNAVENTMPMAKKISERAGNLSETWKKFRQRELSSAEFRTLVGSIEGFLVDITDESTVMKNNLNEVLMAQDFQDLTGQIITQVITLVEEVEGNLIELVRITGGRMAESNNNDKSSIEAEGPQIPGVGSADVVSGQDDVDDLLSSLGF